MRCSRKALCKNVNANMKKLKKRPGTASIASTTNLLLLLKDQINIVWIAKLFPAFNKIHCGVAFTKLIKAYEIDLTLCKWRIRRKHDRAVF